MSAPTNPGAGPGPGPILLFDGVCGLCHGLVSFLIRRDRAARLRFAPLQGPTAAAILARHGRSPAALDTVYLIEGADTPAERLRARSDAALTVVAALGGAWRSLGLLLWLPRPLRDAAYTLVARSRYRLVRRLPACPVPDPAVRARFLP